MLRQTAACVLVLSVGLALAQPFAPGASGVAPLGEHGDRTPPACFLPIQSSLVKCTVCAQRTAQHLAARATVQSLTHHNAECTCHSARAFQECTVFCKCATTVQDLQEVTRTLEVRQKDSNHSLVTYQCGKWSCSNSFVPLAVGNLRTTDSAGPYNLVSCSAINTTLQLGKCCCCTLCQLVTRVTCIVWLSSKDGSSLKPD